MKIKIFIGMIANQFLRILFKAKLRYYVAVLLLLFLWVLIPTGTVNVRR